MSNCNNEILASHTGCLEGQKHQSWNFHLCPDLLPSALLLGKNSDHNLAVKRKNYLPSIFPSGTDRRCAGISREKPLYHPPTWVLKTEQTMGGSVEERMNPILNSAILHIWWGKGRHVHVQTAVFPKAPECENKVCLKMRDRVGRQTQITRLSVLEESSWKLGKNLWVSDNRVLIRMVILDEKLQTLLSSCSAVTLQFDLSRIF